MDQGFAADQTQETTIPENADGITSQIQHSPRNINPILQKIDALTTKVQILRKEHTDLSDEVKIINDESFPGSEVLGAFRNVGVEYDNLKKKYLKECSERKRLYNEVIELKGNIRVFCRCRPLNQIEIDSACSSVVEFNSVEDTELQIVCADSSRKQFKFDHVFGPQDDQETVFAQTAPLATSVLDGFNVCIFAYGQTGTGKTFTMEGTPENRGVNYRTLKELFRISDMRSGTMKYELFVSILEVYNEKIKDLLAENSNEGGKKLDIKQAADGTQEVPGLHEACVYCADDVWEQLKTGSQNRAVGSTAANELSSRSHCLLRVTVMGENLVNGQKTRSHLWLVDLAGSERLGRTEVEGERLKESQSINKSLSALGDVISALASKTSHIPYRNSKLTHLLQSSLGGDCKTLMFVQISASSADLGETLCSLNFASRVRGVGLGPAHKQADHHELFKYKQMAEKQRQDEKELVKLRNNSQFLQLRLAAQEQHCRHLQQKARELENQFAEERKARLQLENRVAVSTNANASSLSFLYQPNKGTTENKAPSKPSMLRPPLRSLTNLPSVPEIPHKFGFTSSTSPSMLRPPLRSITNLPSVPEIPRKFGFTSSTSPTSSYDKDNASRTEKKTNIKNLMQPRRVSIAQRPPQHTTHSHQPRRRVSISTTCPESHLLSSTTNSTSQSFIRQPKRRASTSLLPSTVTPQNTSKYQNSRNLRRTSRLFSPMPVSRSTPKEEVTPVARRIKSSPELVCSWKPKHPTVVALHRRHFVWSPLKQKVQKNDRKSSLSSISSDYWK